ncbi:Ribosome hibernation promotion factor [Candidatus Thermoflexus japonica]|uniref:Ribosome hibernation promoting factor n=1 Tax=Candidatus Thermoflexus japonica TaxID=2035417 RepID=A0A2H5Y3M2_9CHLR|nr:Ribosome hibernation promotion factor [Candidatus Thermoflexus japonica]
MELIIRGRNIEITDQIETYARKRIARLERFLPTISQAELELAQENTRSRDQRQIAQLTLRMTPGILLRAEERHADLLAAIDLVVDKMERRIERFKGRREGRIRAEAPESAPAGEASSPPGRIVKIKRFEITAMTPEEAIEQMELLGHDFFIFYNPETASINLVYRRRDGNYGLIQPELA